MKIYFLKISGRLGAGGVVPVARSFMREKFKVVHYNIACAYKIKMRQKNSLF